ncbi:MAG: cyclic-di-AMP receptor [Aggregatilineales bacterium]
MKLVLATIQDADAERVIKDLTAQGERVTRIGSTGGFLQQGNTTLMLGVVDEHVNAAIEVLRRDCKSRAAFVPVAVAPAPNSVALYNYLEVQVGGAVVFVLNVEYFEQI